MTTVTFDVEHDLQLDAYLPDMSDKVNDRALSVPVVIHYHRGGMLIGSKDDIYPSFMPVVVGVSGGNYPARAAATLNSIVPRPIGWLDLFGMGGDWLLDFWINGVDVERTMPLDITLHDMAKADELMKTGGGAVVSEVESVLVDGKATDELGRFNLWIAWQKRGIFLDYARNDTEEKRRLLLPITPDTPPTYVLHGKEDLLVPFEESLTLENDMKEQGLSIEIDWVDGADHVLRDRKKGGWNGMVDGWEDIAKRALNWAVDLESEHE
ncbi:hypothetical protein LQV05_006295 [Cryptococcus neoformans]|nr:hypothetical protein LQV05_006295 [Cryptococcus neoformans]